MIVHARSAAHGLPRSRKFALWRNLVARFPRDAAVAAQYVLEMRVSESWGDLDAFAAAAHRYGLPEIDMRYVDAALVRLDLLSARRRLDRFLKKYGPTPDALVAEYRLASLGRDFAAAETAAKRIARLDAIRGSVASLKRRASTYRGLCREWQAGPPATDFDVFLINLDSDTVRLQRTERQLAGVTLTRIPAVKGAYLPSHVESAMSRGYGEKLRGTLGCFLSHVVAWERVVQSGRPGLVLEDDACIFAGLPPTFADLGIPDDFDVCFVNERMIPSRYKYGGSGFRFPTVSEVVPAKPVYWSAAGADGYFLSPAGAKRLLAKIGRDGIAGDVDWRMLAYSLDGRERRAMVRRGGFVGMVMKFHVEFVSRGNPLRSYVCLPPLVGHLGGGSVRSWDNVLTHSHEAILTTMLAAPRRP